MFQGKQKAENQLKNKEKVAAGTGICESIVMATIQKTGDNNT